MNYRDCEDFIGSGKIVGNMVGLVLRNHGLAKKEGADYFLCLDEKLTESQTTHLTELCRQKLAEYEAKRGEQIWQHLERWKGRTTARTFGTDPQYNYGSCSPKDSCHRSTVIIYQAIRRLHI
jgi:hypothetical protein